LRELRREAWELRTKFAGLIGDRLKVEPLKHRNLPSLGRKCQISVGGVEQS
jgi:hypothetical protein